MKKESGIKDQAKTRKDNKNYYIGGMGGMCGEGGGSTQTNYKNI